MARAGDQSPARTMLTVTGAAIVALTLIVESAERGDWSDGGDDTDYSDAMLALASDVATVASTNGYERSLDATEWTEVVDVARCGGLSDAMVARIATIRARVT